MRVLVDTSVWSLALRRRRPGGAHAAELRTLIEEGRALLIGPIRQEILSGIRERAHFEALRERLRHFPDLPLETTDYERAAEHLNTCRRAGVQGSSTDFLVCASAERHEAAILTADRDFELYARHLPIRLHRPTALSKAS